MAAVREIRRAFARVRMYPYLPADKNGGVVIDVRLILAEWNCGSGGDYGNDPNAAGDPDSDGRDGAFADPFATIAGWSGTPDPIASAIAAALIKGTYMAATLSLGAIEVTPAQRQALQTGITYGAGLRNLA